MFLGSRLLVILVLWGGLFAAMPAQASRYTLEQLISKVRADYDAVNAAKESAVSAEAALHGANRMWAPSGDLSFGITGAPKVQCADINGFSSPDRQTRERNCVSTGYVDLLHVGPNAADAYPIRGVALQLSLNLWQPIYSFGKIEGQQELARSNLDAANTQVDAAREDVAYNAVRAYWGTKWARAADITLSDGLDKMREWIDKISNDLDAGKTEWNLTDLKRLQLAADSAEMVLADVRRGLAIALAGMRQLTGDPEADVDEAELDEMPFGGRPLSYYEDAARLHRPEARALDASLRSSRATRKVRLAEMLPDLGLAFNLYYTYTSSVDTPQNYFLSHPTTLTANMLLTLRMPLDLAQRHSRLVQARADERAAEARRKASLGSIALEIETAYANAEEARARLERTHHAEKLARGWYRAVDDQVQLGVGQSRDLVEAARSYFEMRMRHLQAIMDTNVALVYLRRMTGVD